MQINHIFSASHFHTYIITTWISWHTHTYTTAVTNTNRKENPFTFQTHNHVTPCTQHAHFIHIIILLLAHNMHILYTSSSYSLHINMHILYTSSSYSLHTTFTFYTHFTPCTQHAHFTHIIILLLAHNMQILHTSSSYFLSHLATKQNIKFTPIVCQYPSWITHKQDI